MTLHNVCEHEVDLCREWLACFAVPSKTWNTRYGSNTLVLTAERWLGEYVSNEALIEAARRQGLECRPVRPAGRFVHFKASFLSRPKEGCE